MITDILIQLVTTLIDKGFTLPIYIFMVSQNGNLVCARYEGNPIKGKTKVHVFVEHIEDPDWKLPNQRPLIPDIMMMITINKGGI